jgi:predicted enzyme related to lactoylglutathione lyase
MSFTPPNAAVWFEIPVSDMKRAKAFYEACSKPS